MNGFFDVHWPPTPGQTAVLIGTLIAFVAFLRSRKDDE